MSTASTPDAGKPASAPRRRALKTLEITLFVLGGACLAYVAAVRLTGYFGSKQEIARFRSRSAARSGGSGSGAGGARRPGSGRSTCGRGRASASAAGSRLLSVECGLPAVVAETDQGVRGEHRRTKRRPARRHAHPESRHRGGGASRLDRLGAEPRRRLDRGHRPTRRPRQRRRRGASRRLLPRSEGHRQRRHDRARAAGSRGAVSGVRHHDRQAGGRVGARSHARALADARDVLPVLLRRLGARSASSSRRRESLPATEPRVSEDAESDGVDARDERHRRIRASFRFRFRCYDRPADESGRTSQVPLSGASRALPGSALGDPRDDSPALSEGDRAVDVGANKGSYTFWMRRAVGAGGRVHAFEPQPELAAYLRATCAVDAMEERRHPRGRRVRPRRARHAACSRVRPIARQPHSRRAPSRVLRRARSAAKRSGWTTRSRTTRRASRFSRSTSKGTSSRCFGARRASSRKTRPR